MAYTPQTWANKPATSTPVTAERLTVIENGIAAAASTADAALALSAAAELIRDTIGTTLVEGAGIDIAVDDTANTITITATSVTTGGRLNYTGSAWPTRPVTSDPQIWVSTKHAAAPQPAMELGDMWIRHPDALESL